MAKITVSVIIVTYHSQRTIKACLDSLLSKEKETALEIIVVDNHSTDETTQILSSYRSKVTTILLDKNVGYGRANNMAAAQASGEYLLFFNPDCRLKTSNGISKLLKILKNDRSLGMVGPKLIHSDGKIQLSVRKLPTVWGAIREFLFNQKGQYEFYAPEGEEPMIVESMVAASALMPKKLFDTIGGFDSRYFMYFEDLELCKQIGRQGYLIGYCPSVEVGHVEGESGKGSDRSRQLALESSKIYFGSFNDWLISIIGRLGHAIYG